MVTVLFADLVGYTALTERLDPEQVKRLIDGAFAALQADIVSFGGRVDKVLGDGILAMFGAPVAHEDDPDRAVRAAIQMHDSLARFARRYPSLDGELALRIGINTGEVLVGSIAGTDDYTAMGDVVNLASRLQSLAPPRGIYVGDATANQLSDQVQREAIHDVEVRGRAQVERVWNVLGVQHRTGASPQRYRTPFVGRVAQRELLQSAMSAVVDGRSAIVSVSGEAGVGKTRLVNEMLAQFPARAFALYSGVCAPYGDSNVWAPIATAFLGTFNLNPASGAAQLRSDLRDRASTIYGLDATGSALDQFVEAAAHLLGLPSKLDGLGPVDAREELFRFVVEGTRRRSKVEPVVMWIDDLQWADPLLVELLERLARSLVDRPFLLLTAQRDDAEIDWPPAIDHPITIRLPLDPLSPVEADDLLEALFVEPVTPAVGEQLYERSGGNPLFLTELAVLAREHPDSTELPGSLRALIAARLDRLDSASRAVLDNAAVLGAAGRIEALYAFAEALGQTLTAREINMLDADGLLELDGERWHFRSDVVREVAYQMLTKLVRAQRHAGVAAVMGADPTAPVEQIAYHAATAAELVDEIGPVANVPNDIKPYAVGLLLRAVRRSLDVGALAQAARHASRALELGPDSREIERELLLLRAEASVGRRETVQARRDAVAALESAMAAGAAHDEGKARRYLGQIEQIAGNLALARAELSRSVDIFRELNDDIEIAASLRERGFAEIFGGSLADADWLLGEAEALTERLGDRRGHAWVLQHQAWVAFFSGDVELADARLHAAFDEFAALGDRDGGNWASGVLAYLRFYGRRFDEAEELARTVRAEGIELGERWSPAMMDALLSSIRLWAGQFSEAERLSRRALEQFRELDDKLGLIQALGPRTRALVALGRDQEAEQGIEEVLSLGDAFGNLAFASNAAAGAAVHLGVGEAAVLMGEQAVEQMSMMGANAAEPSTTWALALCQAGRPEEALVVFEQMEVDFPYACAVRALASAMCGLDEQALADSDAVTDFDGASYLDVIVAGLAAATVEVRESRPVAAEARLKKLAELAGSVGDQVAINLVAHLRATLWRIVEQGAVEQPRDEARFPGGDLRVGWHQVIAGLAGVAAHPAVQMPETTS